MEKYRNMSRELHKVNVDLKGESTSSSMVSTYVDRGSNPTKHRLVK
jgi:hypothetical protein